MTNGLLIYGKNLHIYSYIIKPFLVYDFAPDPIWISLYMRKFSFLLYQCIGNPEIEQIFTTICTFVKFYVWLWIFISFFFLKITSMLLYVSASTANAEASMKD